VIPAADSPRPRGGSLSDRSLHFALLLLAFGALVRADAGGFLGAAPAWWLLPAAAALAWAGVDELAGLFAARGIALPARLLRPAAVAVVIAAAAGGNAFATPAAAAAPAAAIGWSAAAVAFTMLAVFGTEIVRYSPRDDADRGAALDRVAAGTFTVALVGLPLAFMVGLRLIGGGIRGAAQPGTGQAGILPLVSLVAVAKGGDVAAYIVGSLVGRHRMAPRVSPGKTWEGAAASLAGSVAAAWLVLERFGAGLTAKPAGGWLAYGLAVGAAAVVGDLAESLVKRECGAKDSGRTLGGLGGVLDLVDSFLFAAPVAWLLWANC
jgi:phosphatidate cytidylyltransferase